MQGDAIIIIADAIIVFLMQTWCQMVKTIIFKGGPKRLAMTVVSKYCKVKLILDFLHTIIIIM